MTEAEPLSLACPFYKRDPLEHSGCVKYKLKRIKDVKQHIYRHHSKPPFHCPRCFKTFETLEAKDSHLLDAGCSRSQGPGFKGISESQHRELSQNSGSFPGESFLEQWRRIWKVLFQDAAPPQSCYLGSYSEEVVVQLRVFWNRNRAGILSNLSDIKFESQAELADGIMEETFKQFEQDGSNSDTKKKKGAEEELHLNSVVELKSKPMSEDALVEQKGHQMLA